ncbi:hypothetical protein ACWGB8_01615 [Kitasatospora sp. NPDC054939]
MPKTSSDYEKPKAIRIPTEDEWDPFGDATKAVHPNGRSPRTAVIREFMRWYMRRPGAKLPTRPDAGPWSTPKTDQEQPATD